MVCSPRLLPSLGNTESFGQCVKPLEHQFGRDVPLVLAQHLVAELLFKVLADNENNLSESRFYCVIDAVVHYRLSVRAETVELFQATVAASHSCCEE